MYSGKREKQVRDFLETGSRSTEQIELVKSSGQTGRPFEGAFEEYAGIFEGLSDGLVLEVAGEYNGFCVDNVDELAGTVEDKCPYNFDVESGPRFPEEKLERTDGVIHWRDRELDRPQQIDSMPII